MATPSAGQKPVQLSSLPLNQLLSIRETMEAEVQQFGQSSVALQNVATEFATSGRALEALGEQTVGQPMLVPLTQSVYVAAELADTGRVLLDIGTGYFMEKSLEGGVEYCKRKVNLIAENMNEIGKARNEKVDMVLALNRAIQQKQGAVAAQPSQ